MRFSRRYLSCLPTRRNPCPSLLLIFLICLLILSWLLYQSLITVLENGGIREFLYVNSFKTHVREEILKLNSLEDIEFQGEESVAPPLDLTESENDFTFRKTVSYKPHKDIGLNKVKKQEKNTKKKKQDPTLLQSQYKFNATRSTGRYLFIFGHYEQLGKTTINFFNAGLLAKKMKRDIVIPFVRNSRYCGFPSGWTGVSRRSSRAFFAMDNYFNMKSVETLFINQKFARLSSQVEHKLQCFSNTRNELKQMKGPSSILIYFLYDGQKTDDKRYLQISEDEYIYLKTKLNNHDGWTNCDFITERLSTQERMKNIHFTTSLCIDPEIINDVNTLENLVQKYKCLSIFLWRGVGFQRTHFNITLPNSHETYLSKLDFSHFILQEVDSFTKKYFHGNSYISIQIRSERQLSWYGVDKFRNCMELVSQVLNILVTKKKIKYVFLASDLEQHGSDVLHSLINQTSLAQAKEILSSFMSKSNIILYNPDKTRGWIYNDAGFVALTQMELLMRGKHMITLGAGTFQSWIIAKFKRYRKEVVRTSWSLTRVCSTEVKNSKARSSSNRTSSNS